MEIGPQSQGGELERELEIWRAKVVSADTERAKLKLEKLEEDDRRKETQKEMEDLQNKQDQCQHEFKQTMKGIQDDLVKLEAGHRNLMDHLQKCQEELVSKRAKCEELQQKSKIHAKIPEMPVKFVGKVEEKEAESEGDVPGERSIQGIFTIAQRPRVLLKGGQALITFEEEKVALQILKLAKCSVACDKHNIDVKPKDVTPQLTVKFEIHVNVSKRELNFSHAPPSMSEERMKDRLEISFSKPSRGGGEVEKVEYDEETGTGKITFLDTGVAESLALENEYEVDLDTKVEVGVSPVYDIQLRGFQTFCSIPRRTILLDGIQDVADEEELEDNLEIYFQKPANYGGEVETIKYISGGNTCNVFLHDDKVPKAAAALEEKEGAFGK